MELNKQTDLGFKNHIIICNWSDNAEMLIKELHSESLKKLKSIIIISEHPEIIPNNEDDDRFQGVMIIKGNPSCRSRIAQYFDIRPKTAPTRASFPVLSIFLLSDTLASTRKEGQDNLERHDAFGIK